VYIYYYNYRKSPRKLTQLTQKFSNSFIILYIMYRKKFTQSLRKAYAVYAKPQREGYRGTGYGEKKKPPAGLSPNGGSRATPYPVPQREGVRGMGDGERKWVAPQKKVAKDLELT
jgi:hypothetical protein